MSVSRKLELTLPPNGSQLIDKVLEVLKQDLSNHFRTALAYPNATFRIQWSSNFYSQPLSYQGQTDVLIRSEGNSVTSLEDQGITPEMEMGAIEIGLPSGNSPALTRPAQVTSSSLLPPATESRGRRDVTARRGAGVEFAGGQAMHPNLGDSIDGRNIGGAVANALSDLDKTEAPLLVDPPSIKEDAIAEGMNKAMSESPLTTKE